MSKHSDARPRLLFANVATQNRDSTLCRARQARNDSQQGCFTGAIPAQERETTAGVYRERDVTKCGKIAVELPEVFYRNRCAHARTSARYSSVKPIASISRVSARITSMRL